MKVRKLRDMRTKGGGGWGPFTRLTPCMVVGYDFGCMPKTPSFAHTPVSLVIKSYLPSLVINPISSLLRCADFSVSLFIRSSQILHCCLLMSQRPDLIHSWLRV